jgi:hypothetical protein
MTSIRTIAIALTIFLASTSGGLAEDSKGEKYKIGSADMAHDGTLIIRVHIPYCAGYVPPVEHEYAPSNPHYQEVLDHLGGMKTGEKDKPVYFPWEGGLPEATVTREPSPSSRARRIAGC